MNSQRLSPSVAEAIEWLALQRSGSISNTQRQRFQQWLQSSQENRDAWAQLEQRVGQAFSGLPPLSRQVLNQSGQTRRQWLRGALGLTGLGIGGWWLQRNGLLPWSRGDLYTGLAERRPFSLDDGSQVLLNARSRVDMAFDDRQRTLTLHEGALSIQVASDPQRPLAIRTAFGEARALGTRFTVSLHEHGTHVWVQESRVQLTAPGGATHVLGAGQGARLHGGRIHILDPGLASENAWRDGLLEVHDQSLADVIEALRDYHPGLLRIEPDAAALRVTGVFTLDDSGQTLRSLQEVLPVKVEKHFGWWTQISLR
ncbi:FecR family protein [Pseudomonas sp. KFB-139]|uniref:FecR family protein n=1 Tax=Pseudomonas serbiensis TaxID=3064350 RepID=A0ABT9CR82_9PSED|nr:FecR family protein [Pseudomonas sp. KFB-138]MDO7927999.1 FecR family protein [Pseudomonas sp. KFB-138]